MNSAFRASFLGLWGENIADLYAAGMICPIDLRGGMI
jgi:hypothetical protein